MTMNQGARIITSYPNCLLLIVSCYHEVPTTTSPLLLSPAEDMSTSFWLTNVLARGYTARGPHALSQCVDADAGHVA